MEFAGVLLIAAVTFGVCWLFDKGYTNAFRNKIQHRSGLAVRINKRYAAFGLILAVLGILAIIGPRIEIHAAPSRILYMHRHFVRHKGNDLIRTRHHILHLSATEQTNLQCT